MQRWRRSLRRNRSTGHIPTRCSPGSASDVDRLAASLRPLALHAPERSRPSRRSGRTAIPRSWGATRRCRAFVAFQAMASSAIPPFWSGVISIHGNACSYVGRKAGRPAYRRGRGGLTNSGTSRNGSSGCSCPVILGEGALPHHAPSGPCEPRRRGLTRTAPVPGWRPLPGAPVPWTEARRATVRGPECAGRRPGAERRRAAGDRSASRRRGVRRAGRGRAGRRA